MTRTATVVDAGRARPLRWWSAAALAAAADRMHAAIEPWALAWGLGLRAIEAGNAASAAPAGVEHSSLAGGSVLLWHEGGSVQEALRAALFGRARTSANRGENVADEVAILAWGELQNAIDVAAAGVGPSAGIRGDASPWSGTVRIDFGLEGRARQVLISAWLDAACAAAWCATPSSPASLAAVPAPLAPVQAVVSSRPVRVAVHLKPVELDLGSLQTLAIGDVLPLPHRLDEPLHVMVELGAASASTSWCRAHLAQRDGRLVAELAAAETSR